MMTAQSQIRILKRPPMSLKFNNPHGMSQAEVQAIIRPFQATAPVNVTAMAEALGLKVWEMKLPPKTSGKLFRDKKNGGSSGFSIGVNADEGYVRRRFTVAHEVAHFLLHRDLLGNGIQDDALYRSGLSSREETEANRLAADILMPYRLISKLQAEGKRSVGALAYALEVSSPAMQIRLGIPTF